MALMYATTLSKNGTTAKGLTVQSGNAFPMKRREVSVTMNNPAGGPIAYYNGRFANYAEEDITFQCTHNRPWPSYPTFTITGTVRGGTVPVESAQLIAVDATCWMSAEQTEAAIPKIVHITTPMLQLRVDTL